MSKYHKSRGGGLEKAVIDRIVTWYTPRLLASFALSLYDKTDMSVDDIKVMMQGVDQLWRRAEAEGWDIRQNCLELTGIDVIHWKETGNIQYDDGGDRNGSAGD